MLTLLAQITNPALPGNLGSGGNETGAIAIGNLISSLISILLIGAAVLTIFYVLLGGVFWITSGGDKAKLTEARDRITNAIIGLIVVAASWAIMSLVMGFLGIEFPNLPFPTLSV